MNKFNPNRRELSEAGTIPHLPESLRQQIEGGRIEKLDVGPILAAGQEPFQEIMKAVDRLAPGRALKLKAPFEPVPLYAVLGRKGLAHWSKPPGPQDDGAWEIFFYREGEGAQEAPAEEKTFSMDEADGAMIDLDVRGLEPPEPLERVMEAAEQLSYGDILRVRHHREPLILFDVLAERGFAHRSGQRDDDDWEIRVWRKS